MKNGLSNDIILSQGCLAYVLKTTARQSLDTSHLNVSFEFEPVPDSLLDHNMIFNAIRRTNAQYNPRRIEQTFDPYRGNYPSFVEQGVHDFMGQEEVKKEDEL